MTPSGEQGCDDTRKSLAGASVRHSVAYTCRKQRHKGNCLDQYYSLQYSHHRRARSQWEQTQTEPLPRLPNDGSPMSFVKHFVHTGGRRNWPGLSKFFTDIFYQSAKLESPGRGTGRVAGSYSSSVLSGVYALSFASKITVPSSSGMKV